MTASAVTCVQHIIDEYRRFLRTSYRFLDPQLRRQFEEHLAQADVVVRGPYVTLSRDFKRGAALSDLVMTGAADPELLKAHWPFGENPLYRHQERALETGRNGRSFVVTTGTGSGKTEAFLLPVLDGILRRKREGIHGVQGILLYPMNALANDQLERLRRLPRDSDLNISYALYTGDSDTSSARLREAPAQTELLTREDIRRNPPDLLLTNYKQLEFLLVRAADRVLFAPCLRYLVLDELHSYRGVLATEIACLIRRLKAHAGLALGTLVGIGTSATVASEEGGTDALAEFATELFGETFHPGDVIGEELVVAPVPTSQWVPPPPDLTDQDLLINPHEDAQVVRLAERITGKRCPPVGPIADRVSAVLTGNAVVEVLERTFSGPASLIEGARDLIRSFPDRGTLPEEGVRREVAAYLLVGSIGDEHHAPRLRPKLHTFVHGVYDISLCLNPDCRRLIPHGGSECPTCGSAARPAALCRTCGQDFVKVRFEAEDDQLPVGDADFYSDDRTAFLTPQVHQLAEAPGVSDEEQEGTETGDEVPPKRRVQRVAAGEDKLEEIRLCVGCGRVLPDERNCPACNLRGVRCLLRKGPMHSCPACGDVYTRGDIVSPLRTGTASTISAMAAHHLDLLEGEDRKLLVFADNRQDVAHQAGYTADKNRAFALRHMVVEEVRNAGGAGIYLQELPQRLFDRFLKLGIIQRRPTRPERERWLKAITYELANEFSRYSRQRASLENLGLLAVEYEFLEDLESEPAFVGAVISAGIEMKLALTLVRALLDIMRKNRALAFDFFQEYIDPNKKYKYRELEAEPYGVRFPDRDRGPKGFALDRPDHIRKSKSNSILGFYQENPHTGQLTAFHKVAARVIGDRRRAEAFIRALVPILEREPACVLMEVRDFPIAKEDRVATLRVLQLDPKTIRLVSPAAGFRCNACQTWRPYLLPTCPTPKCTNGTLLPDSPDQDSYYVRLFTSRSPQRLAVVEHSAQITGEERARRETDFKDGRVDLMVCTPTLELGVDIGPLLTVILRNAPPTPANYVQRVGRAGRRLRIGFVTTFCAGGAHDRHAFENPEWLVAGHFSPPRVRLDNHRIVHRHLRSFILESVDAQLPFIMGDFLDDPRSPSRWESENLSGLFAEVEAKGSALVSQLEGLFADDRRTRRTIRYGRDECAELVGSFRADLSSVLEAWWERVQQLDEEFRQYSAVGSPAHDMKKAAARQRAYREITVDRERAYTLNYLSMQGLLPAYQFPVDTFSLDPGVIDTPTLYRPSAIAIEEFAPGNFVYANGHKLRSIRVLFAGGPGRSSSQPARSDAETSGRLRSFQFCECCDHVTEEVRNNCPSCGAALPAPTETVFVDAFEAEESLRIGSDEESRERRRHVRRENLLPQGDGECHLYEYPFSPLECRRLSEVLITNWGQPDPTRLSEGMRFWLCPDCGRHQSHDPSDPSQIRTIQNWMESHARICSGAPVPLVLAYKFQTDCLVLSVPNPHDTRTIGRSSLSPTLVTLAEALLAGAADLLELETHEIAAFPRRLPTTAAIAEIVFYETVPGGAGYVEEMARRLPEVAQAARERLYGHACARGCYLCLKHYRNQGWHNFFDKDRVRPILLAMSRMEPIMPLRVGPGEATTRLRGELQLRRQELEATGKLPGHAGPQSPIEQRLLDALRSIPDLPPPVSQMEIRNGEQLVTIADFAYPNANIAVFCDGFAFHGNPHTLELDAQKRNWLQSKQGGGWVVLTYWGKTIMRDPEACAREVADLYRQRQNLLT